MAPAFFTGGEVMSTRRLLVTGKRLSMIMDVGPDDTGYVCMPLFHSNAVQVGWAPSIVYGASVGLARKFSASGWLPDVRHYGATYFNYTGTARLASRTWTTGSL